ncbi:MAG: FxsA family protein [Gammaproteobacteria bacterium]|nr:FxsA family protein [Gammaproteobacteria bacterium]
MRWAIVFFIAVPLGEMLLLFEVSDRIGGLWTIFLVVLTAVIGVQILKRQGFSTLGRANQRISAGELPAQEIVEGLMLAFAGALLLTPGFITDTIGFICLTTPVRRLIAKKVISSGMMTMAGNRSNSGFFWSSSSDFRGESGSSTFEGEFSEDSGYISGPESDGNGENKR